MWHYLHPRTERSVFGALLAFVAGVLVVVILQTLTFGQPVPQLLRLIAELEKEELDPNAARVSSSDGLLGLDMPGGYNASGVANVLTELSLKRQCGVSSQSRKYRSLICTIVRNDVHLREYVVRNLLVGFCHIVVYDNNRIFTGIDHNISAVLDPFVKAGLVTHVSQDQSATDWLGNDYKNECTAKCLETYGSQADWAITMDTDEAIVFGGMNNSAGTSSVGALDKFLTAVEKAPTPICGLRLHWVMMYGEHRVLRHDGDLLMDAFPRIMSPDKSNKVLFRPGVAHVDPPHGLECSQPGYIDVHKSALDNDFGYKVLYLHYYAKTVQEYILKTEQSIPPYTHVLEDAYEPSCPPSTECFVPVDYDQDYKLSVQSAVRNLRRYQGGLPDGGLLLSPPPEFRPRARADYDLYIFFKLRVAMGEEWDEDLYLLKNPDVVDAIKAKTLFPGIQLFPMPLADGLHHFMLKGFSEKRESCWKNIQGASLCI